VPYIKEMKNTMRKSILIVEDELRIRFLLRDYLMKEDFNVLEASNGEEGLFVFSTQKIDLVLLDIMMPIMDGLTMLERLREVSTVPVILLTAKGEEEDKLQGYDYGADDYMTKPFSPKVLIAKVKALLKRTREDLDSSSQDFNGLTINKLSHEVKIDGKEIILSPKEYELLVYLITNEGIALTRDNILDNVWGIDYYGDIRTVDTNVKRLREKLLDKANYVITVRGSGYKFEAK
jgi:DNA-binding response OmpR family regulator